MTTRRCIFLAVWAHFLSIALLASLRADPSPTQPANAVNPPYHGAALNSPFPDNYYGADHGGSTLTLTYPFTSRFGGTDHSRGVVTYYCAPFTPRNSEGVYGMDVWLEASTSGGAWTLAGANGGLADGAGSAYQPVNTPNPGPSPAYHFQWTFDSTHLPPQTTFQVFIYVYLYNQGGGSQGNFYVGSSTGSANTGAANDAPSITWDASYGAVNPSSVTSGSAYSISATATDDNGNLTAVQLYRNGTPWAAAGGGDGWTSSAAGTAADSSGTITYSAQATDAGGLSSALISTTVTIIALQTQPGVSSSDAALTLGQAFTPAEFGGAGSGGWQFAIGGYTNFDAGATSDVGTNLPGTGWIPSWTAAAAGSYAFWVSRNGDATYAPSAIAGPYTLTVTDPSASTPPSNPPTSTSGGSSTPTTTTSPPVVLPSNSGSTTSTGSSGSTGGGSTTPTTPIPPGLQPVYPYGNPPTTNPTTPSVEIARIRFNATGHEAAIHSMTHRGISAIWTDPAGLSASAWPTFASPVPATVTSH